MPTAIAVLNLERGSGKTTIATNLAHALKQNIYTVLAIKFDSQGSVNEIKTTQMNGNIYQSC